MLSKLLDWLFGPERWWICVDRPGNPPDRKLFVLQSRQMPKSAINHHWYARTLGYSSRELADKDCLSMQSIIEAAYHKPFERRTTCVAKVHVRQGQFVTTGDVTPLADGDMSR